MNWQSRKKRVKHVNISLEYIDKCDLRIILDDLTNLIAEGKEMYYYKKKSIVIKDKWHDVKFQQFYVDTIHESKESEINGELKFVIKSNI